MKQRNQTKPNISKNYFGRDCYICIFLVIEFSNVSSTESNINMWLAKSSTAINRLSVIWNLDLLDRIKRSFTTVWYYCIDAPHGRWLAVWKESLTAIVQECCELYWTSPGGSIIQSSSCMDTYLSSQKPSKLDEQDMRYSAEDILASS